MTASYCQECAKEQKEPMVNVNKSKKCTCGKHAPSFGYEGSEAKWCKQCRDNTDPKIVDLVSKRCEGKNGDNSPCLTCPNFGFPGEKAVRCSKHLLSGMIDVRSAKCKCTNPVQPTYGLSDGKPICCKACKTPEMIDLKKCGKFCQYCDPERLTKTYATSKEMIVVDFLQKNKISFVHNRSIGYEYGNYRPDVKIDCETHFVVIEIDEDQHRGYEKSCEVARMYNIRLCLGKPCIFIRYNPDPFKLKGQGKIVRTEKRLEILLEHAKKYMREIPIEQVITVYRLFYDSDDDSQEKEITVTDVITDAYCWKVSPFQAKKRAILMKNEFIPFTLSL